MLNDLVEFNKIKEGDIKTFENVFRQYFIPLHLYAFSIIGQKETAEEIVQDTFYAIWKNREKIQLFHSLKSYLYKSVKNRALQYVEHLQVQEQYREDVMMQPASMSESDPDKIMEYKELEEILTRTIQKLPNRCKQIFQLHRIDGKKYREIAESLSISIKTVEAEMTKAYRILRKQVVQYSQQ